MRARVGSAVFIVLGGIASCGGDGSPEPASPDAGGVGQVPDGGTVRDADAIGASIPPDASDAGPDASDANADADADAGNASYALGTTWHVATYEAESGALSGTAAIVGSADGSSRAVGDLAGEASGRRAVTLAAAGDAVAWQVAAPEAGANGVVLRFSIPDAPSGGGALGVVTLTVTGAGNVKRFTQSLTLTSRYAWLYGGVADGVALYDVPANAKTYATADTPTHLYDDVQLALPIPLAAGDMVALTLPAGAPAVTLDALDLETVPPPAPAPPGFLALTDPMCGAIPFDVRGTGRVFDGADDASYASVFHAVTGKNPVNAGATGTNEKVYYTNAPGDPLQDGAANAGARGLTMLALADHNRASLAACLAKVAASSGAYRGVYVPPGRFYARGRIDVPSHAVVRGAGMWHSKFVAVDTAPPEPVGDAGANEIEGATGNLVLASQGADDVVLTGFSVFGNCTQRGFLDDVVPIAVHGEFTRSTFDDLWIEHTNIAVNTNGASDAVVISNVRARNTFADGIDFYGSTSHSTITRCEARSTGDDGFAMWSQGATAATVAVGNRLEKSVSSLGWYGNGFAVYGGIGGTIDSIEARDVLNFSGLQLSTSFVPTSVPTTVAMSATANDVTLVRAGGNGHDLAWGALVVGVMQEPIDGVTVSNAKIVAPANRAIDVRSTGSAPAKSSIANLTFTAIDVDGAPACAAARGTNVSGSAKLDDVCSCPSPGGAAATCTATSTATFSFQGDSCARARCAP